MNNITQLLWESVVPKKHYLEKNRYSITQQTPDVGKGVQPY